MLVRLSSYEQIQFETITAVYIAAKSNIIITELFTNSQKQSEWDESSSFSFLFVVVENEQVYS